MLLSIIVPVFNCEPYLDRCLASLGSQTLTHFEVLLVNDGSTDDSPAICDRWAGSDSRIRVFHRSNRGVSAARNFALDRARGDGVLFVDADDYVEPEFLERMHEALSHSDVAVCAYDRVRPDGAQAFVLGSRAKMSMDALFEHTLCTQMIGGGCCNKIFRADLIRELELRFDQRIAVGEDMLFLVRYYQQCERVQYVPEVLYHYRFNLASATETGFAQRRVDQRAASILLAVNLMQHAMDGSQKQQRRCVEFRCVRSSLRLFFQMVLSSTHDPDLMTQLQANMRSNWWSFMSSRHARWLERMVVVAMAWSTPLSYRAASALAGRLSGSLAAYRT